MRGYVRRDRKYLTGREEWWNHARRKRNRCSHLDGRHVRPDCYGSVAALQWPLHMPRCQRLRPRHCVRTGPGSKRCFQYEFYMALPRSAQADTGEQFEQVCRAIRKRAAGSSVILYRANWRVGILFCNGDTSACQGYHNCLMARVRCAVAFRAYQTFGLSRGKSMRAFGNSIRTLWNNQSRWNTQRLPEESLVATQQRSERHSCSLFSG